MQVIAHNLISQYSDRQLNITKKGKEKNTEKLASGYRINRSADDAAGLSISEKLRWQIRGLNRGTKNIGDGISLVQTADGAMSEMHGVLQRVRELSIQAYNDSNTQEDRDAIQDEIGESLKELQRIAETTTFNTKELLMGDTVTTMQITGDEEIGIQVRQTMTRSVPEWLYNNMDKELTVHPGYTQGGQAKGPNDHMIVTKPGGIPDKYYGAKDPNLESQGYVHGKEWTDTIADNPSAKISFSGLINSANTALDLYNSLFDLIGSKISFSCGTCSSYMNSIAFAGSEPSMTTEEFAKVENAETDIIGRVNLTNLGYFEEIRDVMTKYGEDYAKGAQGSPAEQAEVKALAEKIAGSLRDNVVKELERTTEGKHFDRVMKVNGDPYSLYVYDLRDTDVLQKGFGEPDGTVADTSIRTTAKVTYVLDSTMVKKGETANVVSPTMIECGALSPNSIPIRLPNVTLRALGITSYHINKYNEVEFYSESYQKKLQEYYDSAQTQTTTGTRQETYIKTQAKPPVYIDYVDYLNGEPKPKKILAQAGVPAEYGVRTVTCTYRTTTYTKPFPVPQKGDVIKKSVYDPDSVDLIDDAIAKVSDARSNMGAIQNRLEHAYRLNETVAENSQASESRIRDTDMAEEMVDYTKHSILEQAGQAMLAQANQIPQGILSLLQ